MPVAASCADTEASETESPTRLIVNVDVLTAVWPSGAEYFNLYILYVDDLE